MANPDFWRNRKSAEEKSQELSGLKKQIDNYGRFLNEFTDLKGILGEAGDNLRQDDENIIESEIRQFEKKLESFLLIKRFAGPYDKGNAVVSFFAGAGGKDSEDWVAMLRRMYERWAETRGFAAEMIHEHWGEFQGPSGWGLKNASILFKGKYAYGFLKKETGVHRLVRVSPFSAQSLRHTSFALVEVMPEFVKPEEVPIRQEEIRMDFFRSSGPGGQNVNKRETAVRLTHIPTGVNVSVQSERTQERNREIAMDMIRAKLYTKKLEEQKKEKKDVQEKVVSIEWGHQIRSYVLHPYHLAKDHRTGFETTQVERVLDGGLDGFIEAELKL